MYDPPGLPPPGWYPDPERPGASRWWSGTEWAAPTWATPWGTTAAAPDALPEMGSMISGAFRRALERWRALAVIAVVGGALPTVLTLVAFGVALDGVAVTDEELVGWSNDRIPAVVALVVGSAVAGWIGALAMAWLMLRTYDDEIASQRLRSPGEPAAPLTTSGEVHAGLTALIRAGALVPRALLWFVVLTLAWVAWAALLVRAFVAAWPLGLLLLLASIPFGVWLLTKLAFVVQSLVDRPGVPFRRSWEVSRDRFWPVFGRLVVAGVIAGAINYGASTISSFATTADMGFGRTSAFEVDERGNIRDVRLDEVIPMGPMSVAGAALSAMATAMLATSTLMLSLSELYRTRNAPP